MIEKQTAVGQIIQDFMDRFNLKSKVQASKVLGISDVQVRSILEGKDARSGLPFKPRESTLRALVARMNEHAEEKGHPYRVRASQLLKAAGYPVEDAVEPKTTPAVEQPRLEVLPVLNIPDDIQDPPDDWELEVIAKIGGMDWGELDPRKDTWFWYLDKAARRRRLRNLELTWLEEQEIRRERGRA